MKITIEIPNDDLMDIVCKGLLDEAYRFEQRRVHFAEEYERFRKSEIIPEKRKAWYLDHYARRGAEQRIMIEALWNIAESIRNQFAEQNTTSQLFE